MGRLLSSLHELGFFDFAALVNFGASRCKGQPGGGGSPSSKTPADGLSGSSEGSEDNSTRVWLLGLAEDIVCRPGFDQMHQVHHPDAIAHVTHHTQVVGDEKIGQVKFTLQFLTLQFP